MKTWYAIFADDPGTEVVVEQWEDWPGSLGRFQKACHVGVIKGRYVLGMWIIDLDTPSGGLAETFGQIPERLRPRRK